jgi:glutamyl-Q tRNA(Asp) synthetase
MLLRIEDLDTTRSRPLYSTGIAEDLAWLGLRWPKPVLHQTARTEAYLGALGRLSDLAVTYPCFCTRREIAQEVALAAEAPYVDPSADGTVRYSGTCRRLSEDERAARLARGDPHAIRLDAVRAAELCGDACYQEESEDASTPRGPIPVRPTLFGDVVLARKGLPAAYHLAVIIDDAFQGVTLVTRGADLASATHIQVTLQRLLRLPTPRYRHHRLILDEQQQKLAKRQQSPSLRSLRDQGVTACDIRRRFGFATPASQ